MPRAGALSSAARSRATVYAEAVAAYRSVGSPLVYVDEPHTDFYFERNEGVHPFQAEYLDDHGTTGTVAHDLDERPTERVVMVSCMADAEALGQLRERIEPALGPRARMHQLENKVYRGHILEVASPLAGKWSGIEWLCEREGIAPGEVLAVGDDHNDAELVARAGIGVAMGNAVDAVKEAADHVVRTNDQDGAAQAIEELAL